MTTSSTSHEYLYIDSRHSKKSEYTSKMDIQLSHPILNAKSFSVCSFSTANEFFNIRAPHNTLIIGVLSDQKEEPTHTTYTIPPGLYDIPTIIEKLNIQTDANQPNLVWCTFGQNPQGKTTLSVQSNSTPKKRAYIYFPDEKTKFNQSMAARLGFGHDQVAYKSDVELETTHELRFIKHVTGNVITHHTIFYAGTNFTEQEFSDLKIFMLLKSSWGTGYTNDDGTISSTRMVGETGISTNIAYESPSAFLLLKSDLVTDFSSVVLEENSNSYITQKTNILQKIDVDVNVYSYLHFKSNHSDAYKHTLSGKPITHFNLELCDDHGEPFFKNHHKTFSCVLKFEIEENHAIQDLNEKQIQLNQKLQYQSRHIC
jgi:hypothetical protein